MRDGVCASDAVPFLEESLAPFPLREHARTRDSPVETAPLTPLLALQAPEVESGFGKADRHATLQALEPHTAHSLDPIGEEA